jgi:hypothetical protein
MQKNQHNDEEEEVIKKRNRQHWAHFVVVCFLSSSRLVKTLAEIRRKFRTDQQIADVFTPIQHFLFGYTAEEKRKLTAQYWDPNIKSTSSKVNERELGSSLKIQAFLRHAVLAKRLLRLHPSVSIGEVKMEILQSAVRAWRCKRLLIEKAKKKFQDESSFHEFCQEMLTGIEVYMFGKKYGGMPLRTVKIDSDGTSMMYNTTLLNTRQYELSSIYDVVKGHSGFPYQRAKPIHRSWCLHLRLLGGKIIDIEAKTSADYAKLYNGFCRLKFLLSTKAPFFVDQFGIACRAGPSVVKNALKHVKVAKADKKVRPSISAVDNAMEDKAQNCAEEDEDDVGKRERSEADKWRYFSALQTLSREYALVQAANNAKDDGEEQETDANKMEDEEDNVENPEDVDDDDYDYNHKEEKVDDEFANAANVESSEPQRRSTMKNFTAIGRKSLAFVGLK